MIWSENLSGPIAYGYFVLFWRLYLCASDRGNNSKTSRCLSTNNNNNNDKSKKKKTELCSKKKKKKRKEKLIIREHQREQEIGWSDWRSGYIEENDEWARERRVYTCLDRIVMYKNIFRRFICIPYRFILWWLTCRSSIYRFSLKIKSIFVHDHHLNKHCSLSNWSISMH